MDRFPEGGLRKWIPGWLGHYFSRSRRLEILLLIMMLLLVGSAWFFLELADAMMEGDVHAMDRILILALREPGDPSAPIGPPWMEEVVRDITALGSGAVLVLLVSAVAGFLALRARSRGLLYLLLVSTAGGSLMASILKDIFERSRPDLVTHLTRVSTSSFPSGHSVMAAVVYLTLGAILAGTVKPLSQKIYFMVVAFLLAILVGLSRVFLGVHYPSDVLAGWAAGLAWAVLCWLATFFLQRKGKAEAQQS